MTSSPCKNCPKRFMSKLECAKDCEVLKKVQEMQCNFQEQNVFSAIDCTEEGRFFIHYERNNFSISQPAILSHKWLNDSSFIPGLAPAASHPLKTFSLRGISLNLKNCHCAEQIQYYQKRSKFGCSIFLCFQNRSVCKKQHRKSIC